MKKCITLSVAIATVLSAVASVEAASTPILGSGWDEDLVVENTADFTPAGALGATNANIADWVLYESGWGSSIQGLSVGGTLVGPSGTSYDIEDYSGNNAIHNAGTFTLNSPGQFSELAFLTTTQKTGGNGTPNEITWDATVNFSSGPATVLNGGGIEWVVHSPQDVSQDHGLWNTSGEFFYNGTLAMAERTFTLSPADQLRTVTSIDLAITGGDHAVFHAISGAAIPEPTTLVLGLIGLVACGRRRM